MSIGNVPVSSIMVKDVKTVNDNDSIQQACKVMESNKIRSAIVVGSNGKSGKIPVGIVTERDVVRHIALDPSRAYSPAREVMSHPLITISSDTSIRDALLTIVTKSIRRLPVMQNEKLIGIVTDKDIYRIIAKNESFITSLIGDEQLMKRIKELEQPWAYKLGEILHKRIHEDAGEEQ